MKSNNNKKHAIIIIGAILMVPSNYIVPTNVSQQLHQPIYLLELDLNPLTSCFQGDTVNLYHG